MKRKLLKGLAAVAVLTHLTTSAVAQTPKIPPHIVDTTLRDSTKMEGKSTSRSKEEKNRNVMLSAESNSTPRQVNIGLPFQGDIIILENDIPVVYTF